MNYGFPKGKQGLSNDPGDFSSTCYFYSKMAATRQIYLMLLLLSKKPIWTKTQSMQIASRNPLL